MGAAVEQLRCKAYMVAQGLGEFGPQSDLRLLLPHMQFRKVDRQFFNLYNCEKVWAGRLVRM